MTQTVIQIGNSLGVTLPADFIRKNKIRKGSKMAIQTNNDHINLSAKVPKTTQYQAASDHEWFELVKEVEVRYGNALEELAKLQ